MKRKRNTDGDMDPIFDNPILPSYDVEPTKFPNWSTLSCDELASWIKKIEEIMMVSRFSDPQEYENYKLALETARKFYASGNCLFSSDPKLNDSSSLPPLVSPTPTSNGGGGTEDKKPYSWLWLLFVAAGVFVLTRKSE